MPWDLLPFLIALVFTLYSAGVIWMLQLSGYPLFRYVDKTDFRAYHNHHNRWALYVATLPMLVALLSTLLLLWIRPFPIPTWLVATAVVLDLITLGVIVLRLAPLHAKLNQYGLSDDYAIGLVRESWARTVAWTLKCGVLVGMLILGVQQIQ